jgi:hypothetical protein
MTTTRIYAEPPQLLLRMEQNVPNKRTHYSIPQARVLALLMSREWVSLPDLLDLRIASYTRRISDLRDKGHDIICETEWVDGVRHSRYRLVK